MHRVRLLLPSLFLAFPAACSDYYLHGPGPGLGHMMYYGFGGGFMWLLIIIVIGVLIYLVLRQTKAGEGKGPSGETPVDILKKRYARGEITRDEFDRMKKDISE
jgi:putative membrane protein